MQPVFISSACKLERSQTKGGVMGTVIVNLPGKDVAATYGKPDIRCFDTLIESTIQRKSVER
jgi:hypothetical protein